MGKYKCKFVIFTVFDFMYELYYVNYLAVHTNNFVPLVEI